MQHGNRGHSAIKSGESVKSVTDRLFKEDKIEYTSYSEEAQKGIEAFFECDTIQKIYLSKKIANVGIAAFASCPNLELIFVSDQVQSIGEAAFADCKELQYIYVDENNVNYQSTDGNLYSKDGRALIQYAIGKATSDYSIPNGVCKFGSYCFYGAQNLKKVRIASSVSEPGEYLFASCTNLETVIIENGVIEIGKGMFEDCEKLSEISIPESVVLINEAAFWGCKSLTNVSLPKGLKEIGQSAFYFSGIKSLELPQGLEKLGGWVFAYTSVKSVTIPDSVIDVGNFGLASQLESIIVSESHPLYKTIDGNLYSKDGKKLIQYAPGKKDTSFKTPDEVTTLCTGAFYYVRSLTSLTISANVEIIESGCFTAWASQLKMVVFENETGWKYYNENNEPVGDISVSDPEQNAEILKQQGFSDDGYTWKRVG